MEYNTKAYLIFEVGIFFAFCYNKFCREEVNYG